MSPPCVDQAWAGNYLQIAVAVLVFGVGVPGLVLQTTVSENVRDVARRRWRGGRWALWLVIASMAIALCMVWWVPQCDASITWIRAIVGQHMSLFLANVMVSILLVGVSAIWWLQSSYRPERVIRHVECLCRKQIAAAGRLEPGLIADLVSLSGEGTNAHQRVRVILTLKELAVLIRQHRGYRTGAMADCTHGILRIGELGGEESLTTSLRAFRALISDMPGASVHTADVEHLVEALTRLQGFSFASVSSEPLRLLLGALEAVHGKPWESLVPSEALAALGIRALSTDHTVIATETLSVLESITWPTQPLNGECAASYFGLVAHFWARGGVARERAAASLDGLLLREPLACCLQRAAEVHARGTHFRTADLLREMSVHAEVERDPQPLAAE
jgi:hypothetical protein